MEKGRHRGPVGEEHPLAKLTESAVRRIRQLATEGMSQTQIGVRFGICQSSVSRVISGVRWARVE